MALSVKGIERIIKRGKKGRYFDSDGLYLQLLGSPSWLYRFQLDHKKRWMGLGPYPLVGLAEARSKRDEMRRMHKLDGFDPVVVRRENRATARARTARTKTFAECVEMFLTEHQTSWRGTKQLDLFRSTMVRFTYPVIGDLDVATINKGHVLQILQQHVAADRNGPAGVFWVVRPTTASRTRQRIESVLDFASKHDLRDSSNPAALRSLPLARPARTVTHHASLPHAEINQFMVALRSLDSVGARALEFTILCAARASEVTNAVWSEIDWNQKMWIVPAARMKGGREHRVALSTAVLELLRALPRDGGPFIFVGSQPGKPISGGTLRNVLKTLGYEDRTDVHGFRGTFRTWAEECTNTPIHIAEMALAHVVGSGTLRAYQHSDLVERRRRLMEMWADHCSSPTHDAAVVPLRRTAEG
jgi:integrase